MPGGLKVTLLNDDLTPVAGAAVQFEAVVMAVAPWHPEVYLTRDTAHYNWTQTATDTTGADGRAWSALRLGCVVGGGRVRIRIPARQIDTTLAFDVVPGAGSRVQLSPSDTAVIATHSVTLRGGVVDQCGNARPDPVTISVDAHATLLGPGLKFGGGSVGLARVIATNDSGAADTATITVVPAAVLAAFNGQFQAPAMMAMNLDGSGYRVVSPQPQQNFGVSWGPQGSVLFGNYSNLSYSRLTSIVPQGTSTLLLPLETVSQSYPNFDGLWVYYSRGLGEIWRVRPDGTGNARVGPVYTIYSDSWPWASPDGTRVVLARTQTGFPAQLTLLTLFSGQVTSLGQVCSTPSWSPDGTRIACMTAAGTLLITSTVGTTINTFPIQATSTGLAWTPDNLYVVVSRNSHLELVDVQNGATLPLPYTANWQQPSLRAYP